MKSKGNGGTLFGLLAKNYLLFTLSLLLIAGGVYLLWNARLDRLYEPADWNALLADSALAQGEYEKLTHYIRSETCAFAVLDAAGTVKYQSSAAFTPTLTAGELSCLRIYQSPFFVDATPYVEADGSHLYLVTQCSYAENGVCVENARMVLDQDLRVVSGGLGDGRSAYTAREFAFLTGREPAQYELYRVDFTAADGTPRVLLLKNAYLDEETFYRGYQSSWRIWLLFVPLYILATGLFIGWLNRTIRRPLDSLNRAVLSQTAGAPAAVGDCGGTREIRQIGESFDQLTARLRQSEIERRALDEGRQKLIADISHDLKTPVTVISGYAEAICDGKVPPEKRGQYLTAIRDNAETLTELINAFHEYSKVEHPKFALRCERTDICEFSREYLAKKYDEIDLAGFALEVSIPEVPIDCMLDEFQFRRVLDNLLSNSLRHNRLGTILFFDVCREERTALLRVADNGTGIPPERAKRIFEPFVVGSDARNSGGSGLGLSITRRIVELHGGAISLAAEPSPGRSSEFLVRLPLAPPQAEKEV